MFLDYAIGEKNHGNRWISKERLQKLKVLNERVLLESWLGRILVLINYFVMRKLVHTTGEAFIPNYPIDADKYIVVLTWATFTIIAFISVIQVIVKNKIYILDHKLSQNEIVYYKYKLLDRMIRVVLLGLFYIALYQIFFQFTIEGLDIKTTILWWIIIVNAAMLIYLIFINIKNKVEGKLLEQVLDEVVECANKGEFEEVYKKLREMSAKDSELKSTNLNITLKAIEELITISEKAEKVQEKALLSKTELVANISHDLKTPLTSIINYVDFLRRGNLTEEDKKEFIDILDRKSKRLKTLVEDLKESVGAESKGLKIDLKEKDISKLLKQAISEHKEKIEELELDFQVTIGDREREFKTSLVDENKILRVFENLISNILKYSKVGSRVYIKMEQEESLQFEKGYYTKITFKNISAEEISFTGEELTQRFKRGDLSRKTEGSGLGLDIAKGLLKLQGGELRVNIVEQMFTVDLII